MSEAPDLILDGLARGWAVRGSPHHGLPPLPAEATCEVAILGSGAGGGITAEILARAGLDVVLVEEGPLRSRRDFRQRESEAYPTLYRDSAAQTTADHAITLLQGRAVGGSTTVNWTSSFRTPPAVLAHWRRVWGLGADCSAEALAPWFAQVERRLGIAPWTVPPNANNAVLARGAAALGWSSAPLQRNVRGCWNLGSCGLGCPTEAKQSMLVSTVPVALDAGARLWVQARAERLRLDGGRVVGVELQPVGLDGAPAGPPALLRARHVVVAAGAVHGPALLLRSGLPDPQGRLGGRSFLHPVVLSAARFAQPIAGWSGAPQSVYSDQHLDSQPLDGPLGFKLETPPLHPLVFATLVPGHGPEQAVHLRGFPHTQALLALLRDGFHPDAPGGQVRLDRAGRGRLHYPWTAALRDGARRALQAMAALQFAAGARAVLPVHEDAVAWTDPAQARAGIAALALEPLRLRMVSAHLMGGCGLAGDPRHGVLRPDGRHWQVAGLSVHDGSIFPTSLGVNPQLSIYGWVNRLAQQLATELGGHPQPLA